MVNVQYSTVLLYSGYLISQFLLSACGMACMVVVVPWGCFMTRCNYSTAQRSVSEMEIGFKSPRCCDLNGGRWKGNCIGGGQGVATVKEALKLAQRGMSLRNRSQSLASVWMPILRCRNFGGRTAASSFPSKPFPLPPSPFSRARNLLAKELHLIGEKTTRQS
ncbi:hypothetical protein B0O99DRAFT_633193 [Bisporella sp. PMI_857]|nr:hypothetical protein B0O99DRAFT_633193 [Bisporella sp. PMI_857]